MRIIRKHSKIVYRPLIDALLAAGLFGVSAPLSKLLLGAVHPIPLAALLYLGAGLGLTCYITWTHIFVNNASSEAGLDRGDLPWLIGAILAGGVTAPILLLYGLRATPAATASLLLNFEVVATAVIAAWLFREFIGQRTWIAVTTVTAGSILLTLDPTNGWGISSGAVLVVAACVMWGLDNNLTRHIALKDPKRIVAIKGLVAGGFSLALALALGKPFPGAGHIVLGLLLGSVSYGISIVLFVRALRDLGAARTGVLFGTAPFIGAAVSLMVFRDLPTLSFILSLPLLGVGVGILSRERHEHRHVHALLTHTHLHTHADDHHNHVHEEGVHPASQHAHLHTHKPMVHTHTHRPDVHHRHVHNPTEREAAESR
jgi:drug/metabolite transporter (DMT)-like permease